MKKLWALCSCVMSVLAACSSGSAAAEAEAEWREISGQAFVFTEVRPDVWHVRGTGTIAVGSNGAAIVNDVDVLVVDSHMTPAAARALVADLALVTDKPIRDVVNTHFHFDHVQGNQVFGPDVEIIAHEFTYRSVADGGTRRGRGYDLFVAGIPALIEQLEGQLETAEGDAREGLAQRISGMRTFWEQDQETVLRAPTLVLREAVTLHRGGREIRVLFLGRGHTGGDVVVYLPAEKALITGDLVTNGIPYMGDGFLLEWAETIGALAPLDVEVVLPGHGNAFEEVERLGHLQHYLRDLWNKAAELHRRGVPAAEAAGAIDMTSHADHFPTIESPGVHIHAVERAYELLDEAGGD